MAAAARCRVAGRRVGVDPREVVYMMRGRRGGGGGGERRGRCWDGGYCHEWDHRGGGVWWGLHGATDLGVDSRAGRGRRRLRHCRAGPPWQAGSGMVDRRVYSTTQCLCTTRCSSPMAEYCTALCSTHPSVDKEWNSTLPSPRWQWTIQYGASAHAALAHASSCWAVAHGPSRRRK